MLTAEQVRARDERAVIKRQIERLVYELYGLRDEEIAIVEEATGEKDECRRDCKLRIENCKMGEAVGSGQ